MPRLLKLNGAKGTNRAIVNKANDPNPIPKPFRPRKRVRPHRRKTTVLRLIKGTRGFWTELARRCECSLPTIQKMLHQPGWELVLEAFREEKIISRDRVTAQLYNLALHSGADQIRLQASQFIVERTNPDFQKQSKVTLEGGDKPIQHEHKHAVIHLPPEMITASPDDKIKLLEMLDEVEVGNNGHSR